MTEAQLKRYLIKSIKAQGGVGHRNEDKFKVGWPDLVMIPYRSPVFFVEVKLIKGAKLICTPLQHKRLLELWRPPHALSCILGYKGDHIHVGQPNDLLIDCYCAMRPVRLDSDNWNISNLLRSLALFEQSGKREQSDLLLEPNV